MSGHLLVMRHGPAEALSAEHGNDAERRLTPEGRAQTAQACAVLGRLLPPLEQIYTSPYLRAWETAELLAAALETPAPIATPLLAPGFECTRLARMLADDGGHPAAIVAHEPDLSEFIAWLSGARVAMGKGMACLTELAVPGTAQLFALYPPIALNVLDVDGEISGGL
jgi:phosphohistidine phosphatase